MVEGARRCIDGSLRPEAPAVGGDRQALSLQDELARLQAVHGRLLVDAVCLLGAVESLDRFPQTAPIASAMAPATTALRATLERDGVIAPKSPRA